MYTVEAQYEMVDEKTETWLQSAIPKRVYSIPN